MELSLSAILWNIVNLAVLVTGLWLLARRPLANAIQGRQARVASSIRDTEEQLAKVAAQLQEQERQLGDAQAETERIAAQARTKSEELRRDLADATVREVEGLRARTGRDIQQETDKAIYELRREAARQAVIQAEQLLRERLRSDDAQEQLLMTFAQQVGKDLKPQGSIEGGAAGNA